MKITYVNRNVNRLAVVLTALLACGIASADPFKPSLNQQIDVGQAAASQLRSQKDVHVLPDSDPRVREIRRIGNQLVDHIPAEERKAMPIKFTFDVIDSKDVNAFALPGGPVFFYTGLLDRLKTEDEVAGILGHELTHVRREHWAKQYADDMKRNLGLIVLLSIIRANQDAFNAASAANQVLFSLKYSRSNESQADQVGYDLMTSCDYNPQGMADVFALLSKLGSSAPEFLSDHPDSAKRAKVIEERIKASGKTFAAQTPRFSGQMLRPHTAIGAANVSDTVDWDANGWPNLPVGH